MEGDQFQRQLAYKKEPTMAWAVILLCFILGALIALKPSGRKQDFERARKSED